MNLITKKGKEFLRVYASTLNSPGGSLRKWMERLSTGFCWRACVSTAREKPIRQRSGKKPLRERALLPPFISPSFPLKKDPLRPIFFHPDVIATSVARAGLSQNPFIFMIELKARIL